MFVYFQILTFCYHVLSSGLCVFRFCVETQHPSVICKCFPKHQDAQILNTFQTPCPEHPMLAINSVCTLYDLEGVKQKCLA